ncbi:MAG: hypothetical protein HOE90_09415 [Bacteriovoracaceae bacterium]|nr:hypothetical protein [Bacteriovoracaceae bacterium]
MLKSFLVMWLCLYSVSVSASLTSGSEYSIKFITKNGISTAEFPGISAFREGTYISIIVDKPRESIFIGLQGNWNGGKIPTTLKDGRETFLEEEYYLAAMKDIY